MLAYMNATDKSELTRVSADSMMARRDALWLLAGGTAVLLGGCGLVTNHPPFRYRLTVEVDTPKGLHCGSSVIEVKAGEVGTTLGGAGVQVRGEAVAVDLPNGNTLFALLRGDYDPFDFAGQAMFLVTPFKRDQKQRGFGPLLKAVRANRKVNVVPRMRPGYIADVDPPFSAYPMLVRFRDIARPATVEWVNPENLAGSFGDGVKLRRITVQLTEDAVTKGIEKRLVWLPKQKSNLVPFPRGVPKKDWPFGPGIYRHDFSKESS